MRRHRDALAPMAEMNVTNLLDTAFTLLVAFMIVAPSIKHGLELDLPAVAGENIDSKKTVTVVIVPFEGGGDRIYVDDLVRSEVELTDLLLEYKSKFEEMDVVMEVDKEAAYDTFARALGAVKKAGIENVGLLTEPESAPPKK